MVHNCKFPPVKSNYVLNQKLVGKISKPKCFVAVPGLDVTECGLYEHSLPCSM